MKKTVLILTAVLFFGIIANAQVWQENVSHNGYSCFSLKTANNSTIYAAKGVEGYMGEAVFIKIQVPYDWGNTGTGCVRYFKENLITGETDSQTSFFHYHNGWLYFIEYLSEWCSGNQRRGSYPCNNYTITIYEKNNHGNSPGNKMVVNLHFDKLNTAKMPMNKLSFETHW